ncbi:MAG: DinB family protein [Tagaea sp.]
MDPLWLRTMAEYAVWMNAKLIARASTLSDEARKRDLGAFFKSLHATLDHVNYGDMAWLARFDGGEKPSVRHGQLMDGSWDALVARRSTLDARLKAWTNSVEQEALARDFTYVAGSDGKSRTLPLWVLATHMINHGTHHRGQATTLLKQLGVDPGETDLPWLPALYDGSLF